MRTLFELITKYKSDVIIVPIIAFAAFVLTLFIYIFFNKKRIFKYIPGLAALIVGLVFLVQGYFELLNPAGLDFIGHAAKILIFAVISILFGLVFDILDSLGKNTKSLVKKNNIKNRAKSLNVVKAEKTKADKFQTQEVRK